MGASGTKGLRGEPGDPADCNDECINKIALKLKSDMIGQRVSDLNAFQLQIEDKVRAAVLKDCKDVSEYIKNYESVNNKKYADRIDQLNTFRPFANQACRSCPRGTIPINTHSIDAGPVSEYKDGINIGPVCHCENGNEDNCVAFSLNYSNLQKNWSFETYEQYFGSKQVRQNGETEVPSGSSGSRNFYETERFFNQAGICERDTGGRSEEKRHNTVCIPERYIALNSPDEGEYPHYRITETSRCLRSYLS